MNTPQTPAERFMSASSPAAAPEITPGGTTCRTPEAIERFRMIVCLSGLKLESHGIKVRRGQSCLTIARRDYGIVAKTAAAAHTQMREQMIAAGIIVEEGA